MLRERKLQLYWLKKKYEQALGLAKENYENNPENSYQIHGYFRCLVRKTPLIKEDVDMLKHLMAAMRKNLSDKQEELYTAMDIEFRYFVSHDSLSDMVTLIDRALSLFPNSINVKRAAQPFRLHQAIILKEESFPEEC